MNNRHSHVGKRILAPLLILFFVNSVHADPVYPILSYPDVPEGI
jgi:hypothetical protein